MANVTVLGATGNQMVAEAFRQAAVDVLPAYPITPQTTMVEGYSKFVADGRVHTEYVAVESEHSAMSASIGASAAGARVATATAAQGLVHMYEQLYIASGMRLPIVMANANRALSAPINIHGDHSDVMSARDSGWIILFAETAQEAYDNTLIAFRVAEHADVLLPVMSTLDGFITTHAMERCELMDDETVTSYVGTRTPVNPLINGASASSHGMFASLGGTYFEVKKAQRAAIDASFPYIQEAGDAWENISGRKFEFIETHQCDDADFIMVVLGSSAGNSRVVADELRAQGIKAGVLRIRLYRPFPFKEVAEVLKGAKSIAILDRSDAFGAEYGPVGLDVRSALYNEGIVIPTRNYIYGLGGADVTLDALRQAFAEIQQLADGKLDQSLSYLGTR
ncbi:MAG: pyruvate ferredoxin oxidoreductase [Coriobacteriia bacterium]|nr:pyruvate ferredoxin oxidoreductase [Coriobacteriia bacterium]